MGVSLRLMDNGHAQVIKVTPRSVAFTVGIQPMWELLEMNGYNIEFHSDEEAYARFNNQIDQVWPMEMVFNIANSFNEEEDKEIEEMKAEKIYGEAYRMLVMALGMSQNFGAISR